MAAAKLKGWMLVRWIDEEKIGLMPASGVVKGYTPYVGAVVGMKWNRGKENHNAEILKMFGKSYESGIV